MPFRDLRQFLAVLEKKRELVRVKKEVNLKYEIGAYIRKTSDLQGPALLFEKVKGHKISVVGGIFATRKLASMALEATEKKAVQKFLKGIKNPIPPKLVSKGPCQEVVLKGAKVDLGKFPIPIYGEKDAGPYITVGVQISKDPETGSKNAAIYRMQVKGKNRLGIMSHAFQHLATQFAKAEAKGDASWTKRCAQALLGRGLSHQLLGHYDDAARDYEKAGTLAREVGDSTLLVDVLDRHAEAHHFM